MEKPEAEKMPPHYGRQTEEMEVQPGREAEDLGEPEAINVGREGRAVPKPSAAPPEPPRLPPDAETPATGTGTSVEIGPSPHADLDAGERREEPPRPA